MFLMCHWMMDVSCFIHHYSYEMSGIKRPNGSLTFMCRFDVVRKVFPGNSLTGAQNNIVRSSEVCLEPGVARCPGMGMGTKLQMAVDTV